MGKCIKCGADHFSIPVDGYCKVCQSEIDKNEAQAKYYKNEDRMRRRY
ncbi:MAG: hypothetical protein ABSC20_11700 [Candidatus Bathyarchaeia archaeon]|jgi:hypothetical protein